VTKGRETLLEIIVNQDGRTPGRRPGAASGRIGPHAGSLPFLLPLLLMIMKLVIVWALLTACCRLQCLTGSLHTARIDLSRGDVGVLTSDRRL
jgi:hypothetical protein